jgi:hypothetical protein
MLRIPTILLGAFILNSAGEAYRRIGILKLNLPLLPAFVLRSLGPPQRCLFAL